MAVDRVILVYHNRFTRRDYERFGIELLKQNGFSVQIWDISRYLFSASEHLYPDQQDFPELRKFMTESDLFEALRELKQTDFLISTLTFNPETVRYFQQLTQSRAEFGLLQNCAIPSPPPRRELSSRRRFATLARQPLRSSMAKVASSVINRLPYPCFGVREARYTLLGGDRSGGCQPDGPSTQPVWGHTLDYDLYLRNRDPVPMEDIAVFLDEYECFHSEYSFYNVEKAFPAETYHAYLDRFFTKVEQQLGVRVVIAAHPRSQYELHPGCYGGRPIVRGQTLDLVRKSRFVMAQASTAVSFACLYRKPLVFLSFKEYLLIDHIGPWIDCMAEHFGKTPIIVNDNPDVDWSSELQLNEQEYDAYRHDYIKRHDSPDLEFWQIVANAIREI